RAMFKKNQYVGWSEHEQWFSRLLDREDMALYIGTLDDQRIGNVRFDLRAKEVFEISINLDPRFRGRGLGSRMLSKAIAAFSYSTRVVKLFAMAKKCNPSSIKTFALVGMPVVSEISPLAWERGFDPVAEVYMECLRQRTATGM
ncbi:MAG: GNAT family N-acetyltransferase, partial [Humidesulfovibrio sp.]|nr:GNAT family N-acetyltransferase [Humidesulfovibrio sp.]